MTAAPVRALHYTDRHKMVQDSLPGSFWVTDDFAGGVASFWFFCPCGCGRKSRLTVGLQHKPITSPSWRWNARTDAPTLHPSVNQTQCGWHGWLRDGYWEVAA